MDKTIDKVKKITSDNTLITLRNNNEINRKILEIVNTKLTTKDDDLHGIILFVWFYVAPTLLRLYVSWFTGVGRPKVPLRYIIPGTSEQNHRRSIS